MHYPGATSATALGNASVKQTGAASRVMRAQTTASAPQKVPQKRELLWKTARPHQAPVQDSILLRDALRPLHSSTASVRAQSLTAQVMTSAAHRTVMQCKADIVSHALDLAPAEATPAVGQPRPRTSYSLGEKMHSSEFCTTSAGDRRPKCTCLLHHHSAQASVV